MRYITPVRAATHVWVGKDIETTDSRKGTVEAAQLNSTGAVVLYVRGEYGDFFTTTNEYATMVRGQ